jgi:5-hydroxyisourate hydrolase
MMQMDRRRLLGAGSFLLAVSALMRGAKAAASPGLTTHMLDTASGKPAEGVKIDFSVLYGEATDLSGPFTPMRTAATPSPC